MVERVRVDRLDSGVLLVAWRVDEEFPSSSLYKMHNAETGTRS